MIWVVLSLAAAYLAIVAVVWYAQDRLLFYPQPAAGDPRGPAGWRVEPIRHRATDGTLLEGVLVSPPRERTPLVIYYGGNAEEATSFAPLAEANYGERALLLVNYRGYGRSSGEPSERALVRDALELYDEVARRPDIDARHVVLHGRSLGTGVAVQVAAQRPARCVILTSPFDSALAVAKAVYPWLPVAILMRHPFDSISLAPRVKAPALVLIGEADTLIAPRHSDALIAAWAGPTERVSFPGLGHNELDLHPRYDAAVRAFLDRCL